MSLRYIASIFLLALAGCGGEPDVAPEADERRTATATLDAGAPPPAFARCLACHAVEPGMNGIGPSLHGIVGQRAASAPGYAYSAAFRKAEIVWDRASLDRWLAAPMTMVPGTKMALGAPDPVQRREVIEYLETLR